jgi:predicted RNA-binding Zn ribbon-like protein
MRVDTTMPWLVFPAAIDLANTVAVSPPREVDLLTDEEELARWVAKEEGRIRGVRAATGRLQCVCDLRAAVRAVLFAGAEGRPVPSEAVAAVNAASAAAPSYPVLRGDSSERVFLASDDFDVFAASVARSAIDVVTGPDAPALSVCRAPSCGMLFLRRDAGQRWCCSSCGNRARVAQHASRRRLAAG